MRLFKRNEFTTRTKAYAFQRCDGRCQEKECQVKLTIKTGFEYDHIIAAAIGGSNDLNNCQVLCRSCHRKKTKSDIKKAAKAFGLHAKEIGAKKSKYQWASRKFSSKPKSNVKDIWDDLE